MLDLLAYTIGSIELGTIEAFRVFDKERTGFISRAELKNVLIGMGETMSEEDAENLLMEA